MRPLLLSLLLIYFAQIVEAKEALSQLHKRVKRRCGWGNSNNNNDNLQTLLPMMLAFSTFGQQSYAPPPPVQQQQPPIIIITGADEGGSGRAASYVTSGSRLPPVRAKARKAFLAELLGRKSQRVKHIELGEKCLQKSSYHQCPENAECRTDYTTGDSRCTCIIPYVKDDGVCVRASVTGN